MRPDLMILNNALKTFSHDQDKIVSPETTVADFKNRLSHTGLALLEDVVRIDKGRLDIPVYFSLCGHQAQAVIGNVKQMGKGASPAQAQASAVMELGERFSLFSFKNDSNHFQIAAMKDLKGPVLDFSAIAQSVQDVSTDLPVVRRFFESLPLAWCWAHNLTREETCLVPFNWFWTINEFNGSSAGNCNEEALCQGICEVVERHVSALVCMEKRRVPLIDPASITDPVALELLGKYEAAGIKVYLSDFTCDMGIPTVGVLAWDPTTFPQSSEIVWTAGTALQPAKALCRALTEVAQLAGDFNSNGNYVASGLPKFHSIEEARYITQPGMTTTLNQLPDLGDANFKTEVERCIQILQRQNLDILTLDVRHGQLDIPAFYTIIPGLRFRERAVSASVAMICAKIVTETFPASEALEMLTEMNLALPDKYYLQFYLGQIRLNTGDYGMAQIHLAKAAALGPPDEDLASIYTYLGLCHKENEQYDTAVQVLLKAEKLDPERTDTLNLLGVCHFKLSNHQAAVETFERCVVLNPSSAIDYANLAVNYRALDKPALAIQYYQLALALDPDLGFAREHLAQMGVPD